MNCPMIDALHVLLQVPCGGTVCGVGNIHGTQVMVLANDGTVKERDLPCSLHTTSVPDHRIRLVPPGCGSGSGSGSGSKLVVKSKRFLAFVDIERTFVKI
jgi:hypothetical protein